MGSAFVISLIIPLMFLLFFGAMAVLALAFESLDSNRISKKVTARGGRLISYESRPFGAVWTEDYIGRLYKVHYFDQEDNTHEAYIKTSLLIGVRFLQDSIIKYAPTLNVDSRYADVQNRILHLENTKLKEEIEKLKANSPVHK